MIPLLLLVCEVTAPLGPYARPGVPVPLVRTDASPSPARLDVDGRVYRFATGRVTLVFPATFPCTVRDETGKELLRLERAPRGRALIGTAGAGRDEQAGPMRVHIDLFALDASHWPCLDVFDNIEGVEDVGASAIVARWRQAGAAAVPRTGNLLPDVYQRIAAPRPATEAWPTARLIVIATLIVVVLQVLLRAGLVQILVVALLAATLGGVVARGRHDPLTTSRLEIVYRPAGPDGPERVRVFSAFSAVGPGASVEASDGAAPVFFRPGATDWAAGDGRYPLEPGVLRLFVQDVFYERAREAEPDPRGDGPLAPLASIFRPGAGKWRLAVGQNRLTFTAVD